MSRYLLRRTAVLIVSLLAAMVGIFVLLRLLPGDPANALLSVSATPEQIAAARAQVGADLPLLQQLLDWFRGMLTLDLGNSFISTLPVAPEIGSRLAVTIPLTFLAFGLAFVLSLVIGFVAAYKADRWYGAALSAFSQLFVAIPAFWVGHPAHRHLRAAVPGRSGRRLPAGGLVRPGGRAHPPRAAGPDRRPGDGRLTRRATSAAPRSM